MENKKIRILALCDSPTSATGFAQVSKNVLKGLADTGKYEIDIVGINYYGDYYDRLKHPYNIYPAMPQGYNDMYGRGRILNALSGFEEKNGLRPGWDIVFTIQDPFIIEGLGLDVPFGEQLRVTEELWKRTVPPDSWFKWIGYFPVDAEIKENWVTRSMALPDYPVAYCEWGAKEMLKFDRNIFDLKFNLKIKADGSSQKAQLPLKSLNDRLKIIHHGVDLKVFKPLPKEDIEVFRKEYFGGRVKDDTYLVVNVSRNQPRKDIARTMYAFKKFHQQVPNSHLYLHCKSEDAGGSINEIARNFNLVYQEDYSFPQNFSPGMGYPVELVNKVYNAADLCVTTTLGEGWGFITTESMATKTPIVAPNITSMLDIFGSSVPEGEELNHWLETEGYDKVRGIPAKAGSTASEWICLGLEDNERVRPLTNVDDLVAKMLWAYRHPEEVKKIVDRGFEWVKQLDWPLIIKQWDTLFMQAYEELQASREVGRKIDKSGRNDPCPCGSSRKFKQCHGGAEALDKYRDWLSTAEAVKE